MIKILQTWEAEEAAHRKPQEKYLFLKYCFNTLCFNIDSNSLWRTCMQYSCLLCSTVHRSRNSCLFHYIM